MHEFCVKELLHNWRPFILSKKMLHLTSSIFLLHIMLLRDDQTKLISFLVELLYSESDL